VGRSHASTWKRNVMRLVMNGRSSIRVRKHHLVVRLSVVALCILLLPISGCLASGEDEAKMTMPDFSAVADNGESYDNARMSGQGFIVVFSAEWCSSPCHITMHAIWSVRPELEVLVMSTDPLPEPNGISLSDWHDAANAHDDTEEDPGVELTTYAFMKGAEPAMALEIDTPGSVAFVNADGVIEFLHTGRLSDTAVIEENLERIDL